MEQQTKPAPTGYIPPSNTCGCCGRPLPSYYPAFSYCSGCQFRSYEDDYSYKAQDSTAPSASDF